MLASPDVTQAFADTAFAGTLRPHQRGALAEFDAVRDGGGLRWCIRLPPGTGKTLIALEAARRLGRPTLVLCPNAAVQCQWLTAWHHFTPATVAATGGRVLWTPITVLPARALAAFDADGEVDEQGRPAVPADAGDPAEDDASVTVIGTEPAPPLPDSLRGLPDHGRELAERLGAGGPWTLVLDEVDHLLEIWGQLLPDLIEHLGPETALLGLTAAAPADSRLTALFGPLAPVPSTPAGVRGGLLAPYQELAHLTVPTPAERTWLAIDAARFTQLRTDLLDPGFTTSGFPAWCRRRFLTAPWHRLAQDHPALATAALRLHHAGLLELPPGAHLLPQHRHAPTAPDWLALITDYAEGALAGSVDTRDAAAYDAIWTALPAVGHDRDGDPATDAQPALRVLARSAAKAAAAATVLGVEHAQLGDRLRALVLCDHERARSALPDRLVGVLDPDAGSAMHVLEHLVGQPATAALDPVLMTARTVACGRATGARLRSWLRECEPALDLALLPMLDGPRGGPRGSDGELVQLTGRGWAPRRWVPLLTRFFHDGGTRVLVGTRGLLGEGWDTERLNVVIDLTGDPTSTAAAQVRGRASRLDPGWPQKVATTWTVVVVSDEHPCGDSDYVRFAATQARLLAPDGEGAIVPGVAHVDAALDAQLAPAAADLPVLTARIQERAAGRAGVHTGWGVGLPCADALVATVHVRPTRGPGLTGAALAAVAPRPAGRVGAPGAPGASAAPRASARSLRWPGGLGAAGALGGAAVPLGVGAGAGAAIVLAAVAGGLGLFTGAVVTTGRAATQPEGGAVSELAAALAEALRAAGLIPTDAVQLVPAADGSFLLGLADGTAPQSRCFADALVEVLGPLHDPAYVVSRRVVTGPTSAGAALGLGLRRRLRLPRRDAEVWHAVPTVLGGRPEDAWAFLQAWQQHAGASRLRSCARREDVDAAAAAGGADPTGASCTVRVRWR